MEIRATTASEALPLLARVVMASDEVGSRGGRTRELLYPHVILTKPWRREILTPSRRASLPAQIAETMWVLAGRNDVEWLSHYLPRAADFSDDGKVWRGGYGPRMRYWRGVDQLEHVVRLLQEDSETRRAVISIYDPVIDSDDGRDIPCNDFITFQARRGRLHMGITIRSNDLIWGWSGINAFEWSAVQEIVAGLLGLRIGELHFSIASLHVYEHHWDRAMRLAAAAPPPELMASPRFAASLGRSVRDLDVLISEWFHVEDDLRTGRGRHEDVDAFPEPMLRSWLRVLEWKWLQDEIYLTPLRGTALHHAALASP